MAAGFPAKGTGGSSTFVSGTVLSASDLNDGFGTLNLLSPVSAAGSATVLYQSLISDSTVTNKVRYGDDLHIIQIMQAI